MSYNAINTAGLLTRLYVFTMFNNDLDHGLLKSKR